MSCAGLCPSLSLIFSVWQVLLLWCDGALHYVEYEVDSFVFYGNILTAISGTDIHVPEMMKYNHLFPLTFHLAPISGQI